MRESIGGTWLFGLVITFIVFFASFLAVSVNYSKAFNVKNNVVDLLGKYEGNTCDARRKIGEYLSREGYLVSGTCEPGYKGYLINGNPISAGEKAFYCVKTNSVTSTATLNKMYYGVEVFFRIDFPVFGDLTTFRVKGETESIYYAVDTEEDLVCG